MEENKEIIQEASTCENNGNPDVINIFDIIHALGKNKILFLIVNAITFIVSAVLIVCIPRTYSTTARVVPETSTGPESTLGSIASSFGFDLGDNAGTDAIYPLLYPDLMEDNGFVSKLFDIRVESEDGTIRTTYYDYMKNHQKYPWWSDYIKKIKKLFPQDDVKVDGVKDGSFDPYNLTKKQTNIVANIKDNIAFVYDKKTSVISINVKAQDRFICKQMADSVQTRLLDFIIEYRTSKARKDEQYYKKLCDDAKLEYENARRQYSAFSDANTDVQLPSLRGKLEEMENDMQLKFNTYNALCSQLQAAQSKVQDRTPAFTLLQGATVPIKPSEPKRMIFVIAMCFVATIITIAYVFKKEILNNLVLRK